MRLLISLYLSKNIKIAKISITEKEIGPKQLLSRESIESKQIRLSRESNDSRQKEQREQREQREHQEYIKIQNEH